MGEAGLSRPVALSVGSGPLPLCCASVVIGPVSPGSAQGEWSACLREFDNNTHAALTYDLMRRIATAKLIVQLDWCPTIPIMISGYLPFLIQLTLNMRGLTVFQGAPYSDLPAI